MAASIGALALGSVRPQAEKWRLASASALPPVLAGSGRAFTPGSAAQAAQQPREADAVRPRPPLNDLELRILLSHQIGVDDPCAGGARLRSDPAASDKIAYADDDLIAMLRWPWLCSRASVLRSSPRVNSVQLTPGADVKYCVVRACVQ
eukprot:scaffold39865_cov62-Phaeocystis_antarctica.AAC.2